jgi:hypothetical protein
MSLGRLITTPKLQEALNTDAHASLFRPSYSGQFSGFNSDIQEDAGVTFVHWVAAEPTFSHLGICLPAMLPLGHYINAAYLSPLASKVSSFINRRGNSGEFVNIKNGYFPVSQPMMAAYLRRRRCRKDRKQFTSGGLLTLMILPP